MHVEVIERELRQDLHDMIDASPSPLIMANIAHKYGTESLKKYGATAVEHICSTVNTFWLSHYRLPESRERSILSEVYQDLGVAIQGLLRVEAIKLADKTEGGS